MAREQIFNGARARELRKDKTTLDLAELAEEIGINPDTGLLWSRDTLSNVELGHKQPGLKLSHAWADALNVPRSELLMDAPEQDTP
jgi:transcriptional regulator with XRE-family HTH domain